MKRALILLTAAVLGAGVPAAGATTAPALTLTQQARKADVIVRASLGTPKSLKEGEVTWVVYPLTVTETIAGDTASLPQTEGKPALYILSGLEDGPVLRAGQEAFFLLYTRRLDSPIVGFTQGVYPLENGRVTRTGPPVPGITEALAAASGSSTPASPGSVGASPATNTTATSSAGSSAVGTGGTGTGTTSSPTTPPASGASAPGAASPGAAPGTVVGPAAPTPAPAADPLGDPAKFRDALRAAREAK